LSEARAKLLASKELLKKGENPTEFKRILKRNSLIAAANTFDVIALKWFEWRKKKKDLDERNALKIWASLERHAFPLIGKKAITDIKPYHILDLIERMQNQGIGDQTTRVFQRVKDIFNYAITTMLIETNPAISINTDIIIKSKSKHHPALPFEWIGRFLEDVDQSKASLNSKVAIRMQILTGVRTTELRGAMWDEIDLENAVLLLAAELHGLSLLLAQLQLALWLRPLDLVVFVGAASWLLWLPLSLRLCPTWLLLLPPRCAAS
jgi:integrase